MIIPDVPTSIFGSLEIAKSAIANSRVAIEKILNGREKRMRKEDVARAKAQIKAMEPNIRAFKVALKEFDAIAS